MDTFKIASSGFSPLDGASAPAPCGGCSDADALGFKFSRACQPIVDVSSCTVYDHEALV